MIVINAITWEDGAEFLIGKDEHGRYFYKPEYPQISRSIPQIDDDTGKWYGPFPCLEAAEEASAEFVF